MRGKLPMLHVMYLSTDWYQVQGTVGTVLVGASVSQF